jgi:hypothetical protein
MREEWTEILSGSMLQRRKPSRLAIPYLRPRSGTTSRKEIGRNSTPRCRLNQLIAWISTGVLEGQGRIGLASQWQI